MTFDSKIDINSLNNIMSIMNDPQFNKWVDMWDKAAKEMNDTVPVKKVDPNKSFFGMSSVDDDAFEDIDSSDIEGWHDVNDRTSQLYSPVADELLTEAEEKKKPKKKKKPVKKKDKAGNPPEHEEDDGLESVLAKSIGDEDQFISPNPIHFASVGKDQKMRVTPNWTAGEALIALVKLKSMMYDLECEMLTAEALGSNIDTLEKRLDLMGKQFDKLSQKLVPNPKNDVS